MSDAPKCAIKVLIADDHALLRESLATLLSLQADISVAGTAGTGRGAIFEAARLQPDVVIMDLAMPDMNGVEAARAIAQRVASARILMLSMYSSAEHVHSALQAGVCGYVLKDSAAREVVEAVRRLRAGERYFSERIADMVAQFQAAPTAERPLDQLSSRERQILKLVADGYSTARISSTLHLSSKTVDTYRSRLMRKLHVTEVATLVKFAIQHGVTSIEE